jgi:hypothetical protein
MRDFNSFRTIVLNQLKHHQRHKKENNNSTLNENQTMTFFISHQDWRKLSDAKNISGNERKRFKKAMADYLSHRLQNLNIKCRLGNNSNWIQKENSQKNSCPWWSGKYECSDTNCKNIYKFAIKRKPVQNENQSIEVSVSFQPKDAHVENIPIKISCRGSERRLQQLEVTGMGVTNTIENNILWNTKASILG